MRNVIFSVIGILLLAATASADTRREKFNLDKALRGAQFIYQTKVVEINYGMSKAARGYEALPHTFVTFEVTKVLKGNPREAQRITLRFLGGRGEQALFFHPGEYPLFDIGDEDILFIRNNNKSGCPLFNCAEGRFRSIAGKIYSDLGQQVVLTKKQTLDFGMKESLKEILTHQVSQTTLFRKEVDSDSEGKPEPNLPVGDHFTTANFVGFVGTKVSALYSRATLDKWPLLNSSDIRAPFLVKALSPVRGKSRSASTYVPIKKPTERDLLEQRELEKNQGNPVIK